MRYPRRKCLGSKRDTAPEAEAVARLFADTVRGTRKLPQRTRRRKLVEPAGVEPACPELTCQSATCLLSFTIEPSGRCLETYTFKLSNESRPTLPAHSPGRRCLLYRPTSQQASPVGRRSLRLQVRVPGLVPGSRWIRRYLLFFSTLIIEA